MQAREGHIRHGFAAVRPYLHGHLDLADFVREVFGPKKFHIESQIGDSVVVLETGEPPHPSAAPVSVYVYVVDVDAAYNRALEFGALPIAAPEDKPYRERGAGVRDSFGNI